MDTPPRISVIMGIYNCENTLEESIESILDQTYQNFEFILCDDGSTDNTYAVASWYAEKYPHVTLLKNEVNKGLNYTLNRCLEVSKGEYIARQDGDDISLATRFEQEIKILDDNPQVAIVSCPMIYFNETGDFKVGKATLIPQKKDFVYGSPFCHAPCMIRRSVMTDVGGYSVSKFLLRVEDYHLWFKIYAKGYTGFNIQIPLYKMRDDMHAYKRRNFRNRINEAYVRYIGFSMLDIPLRYYVYVFRPLLVGLLPYFIYKYLHGRT